MVVFDLLLGSFCVQGKKEIVAKGFGKRFVSQLWKGFFVKNYYPVLEWLNIVSEIATL